MRHNFAPWERRRGWNTPACPRPKADGCGACAGAESRRAPAPRQGSGRQRAPARLPAPRRRGRRGGSERCAPAELRRPPRGLPSPGSSPPPRGKQAAIAKFAGKWAPAGEVGGEGGGGEAAPPPPPRGAPRAAGVPAPPPPLPAAAGTALLAAASRDERQRLGAASTSPVSPRIAVKRAPPAAGEGKGRERNPPPTRAPRTPHAPPPHAQGVGTPKRAGSAGPALPRERGREPGAAGRFAAAPAGLLTASRCCGGCSSGRRAAPARDSPRCSPSRSTAPGTAAAPPRPPSPAAAPGTG